MGSGLGNNASIRAFDARASLSTQSLLSISGWVLEDERMPLIITPLKREPLRLFTELHIANISTKPNANAEPNRNENNAAAP